MGNEPYLPVHRWRHLSYFDDKAIDVSSLEKLIGNVSILLPPKQGGSFDTANLIAAAYKFEFSLRESAKFDHRFDIIMSALLLQAKRGDAAAEAVFRSMHTRATRPKK